MATENMAPDIAVQRQMLQQRIAEYKAQGFNFHMEAEALKVQTNGNDAKALADEVKKQDQMSRNAYAAAKRLQAMLDELPAEEVTPNAD